MWVWIRWHLGFRRFNMECRCYDGVLETLEFTPSTLRRARYLLNYYRSIGYR